MMLAGAARSADLPQATSGSIERLANFPSNYMSARNIAIWLPDSYGTGRCPSVNHIMDERMLFEPAIILDKGARHVDRAPNSRIAAGRVRDTIIVGVANNPQLRHAEFLPQRALPFLPKAVQQPFTHEWHTDAKFLSRVLEGADHNERDRSTRLDVSLTFLLGKR